MPKPMPTSMEAVDALVMETLRHAVGFGPLKHGEIAGAIRKTTQYRSLIRLLLNRKKIGRPRKSKNAAECEPSGVFP
jgi:hypothetical protein